MKLEMGAVSVKRESAAQTGSIRSRSINPSRRQPSRGNEERERVAVKTNILVSAVESERLLKAGSVGNVRSHGPALPT
jgi:hypothetical protein